MIAEFVARLQEAEWLKRLRYNSRFWTIVRPFTHTAYIVMRRMALADPNGVKWHSPAGVVMRIDSECYFNYNQFGDEQDPLLMPFMSSLQPNTVIYDVGSWAGVFAILAAIKEPACKVVAFEMTPSTAHLLQRHIVLNGLERRVQVVQVAVSKESGLVTIEDRYLSGRNSLRPDINSGACLPPAESVSVPMLSLDDFALEHNHMPSAIKIDVEGAELDVLLGARRLLAQCRPLIFCELHRFAWPRFGVFSDTFDAFLQAVNYTAVLLGSDTLEKKEWVRLDPRD